MRNIFCFRHWQRNTMKRNVYCFDCDCGSSSNEWTIKRMNQIQKERKKNHSSSSLEPFHVLGSSFHSFLSLVLSSLEFRTCIVLCVSVLYLRLNRFECVQRNACVGGSIFAGIILGVISIPLLLYYLTPTNVRKTCHQLHFCYSLFLLCRKSSN